MFLCSKIYPICFQIGHSLDIFFSIFINTVLPILLIAGVGFTLARRLQIDRRGITQIIINAFMPMLVFQSLAGSSVPLADFGRIALFGLAVVGISAGLALVVARLLRADHLSTTTLMLMLMFANVGNFGLPVITLAFGSQALTYGTIYFITNNILLYTVGTLIASSGHEAPLRALGRVARMPVIYAVLAAGIVQLFQIKLPAPVMTAVDLLARATIPSMLVVLGIQLNSAGFKINKLVLWGSFARLLATPVLAFFVAGWLGLSGAAFQAGMLESAMPSGVSASVFAVEYDVEPEFAANMVLFTTLVSPFSITLLILLLQRGF
jgi:predicted permease